MARLHALVRDPSKAAVSNSPASLGADVDHRSKEARRLRDLLEALVNDLGGFNAISAAELMLARRAAMLALQAERLEERFAQEAPSATALELHGRLTGNLRRALETLTRSGGLPRRPREIDRVPSVEQYARMVNGEASP